MTPTRITLSRKAGWRMPENTLKVDRTSKHFGNPFKPVNPANREHVERAVAYFRRYATHGGEQGGFACGPETGVLMARLYHWTHMVSLRNLIPQLRGKNLACWCKQGEPCHADVLLELANK